MDESIVALIKSYSDITNEVGNRVFAVSRKQNKELPAIVYRKVFAPRVYTFNGIVKKEQNFDLFVYSKDYSTLSSLMIDLENNLSKTSGSFGGHYIEDVRIEEVGNDDYIDELDLFTDRMEIKIRWKGDLS